MKINSVTKAQIIIALGLVGISLFLIASRYPVPFFPKNDFAQGLWFGVSIGLEIVGLMMLVKKSRAKHAA